MLNIKHIALGYIIALMPFFLSSAEARYPKASITPGCTTNTSCIAGGTYKITPNGLPDEKGWENALVRKDYILDFHPILH